MQCRSGAVDQAVATFDTGLALGLWWDPAALQGDPDLAALRDRPDFQSVLTACLDRQRAARAAAKPDLLVFPPEHPDQSSPLLIVLHDRGNNAHDDAMHWMPVVAAGFLLAVPQSSQLSGTDAYCRMAGEERLPLPGGASPFRTSSDSARRSRAAHTDGWPEHSPRRQ